MAACVWSVTQPSNSYPCGGVSVWRRVCLAACLSGGVSVWSVTQPSHSYPCGGVSVWRHVCLEPVPQPSHSSPCGSMFGLSGASLNAVVIASKWMMLISGFWSVRSVASPRQGPWIRVCGLSLGHHYHHGKDPGLGSAV